MALTKNTTLVSQKTFDDSIKAIRSDAETGDYLNLYPKVGVETGYTEPIINADFKYSIGLDPSFTFSLIDRDSKHVVYYHTTTPVGYQSVFKAYRYSMSEAFIFEPEPITFTFLQPNERVANFINVGTNFILARISTIKAPITTARHVMVRTNGSSIPTDWTLAYDVSSIMNSTSLINLIMVTIDGVDYLISISGTTNMYLSVYNSKLEKLRDLRIFYADTDWDPVDRTGQGRTGMSMVSMSYFGHGRYPGFTWNPLTETIHSRMSCYNTMRSTSGAVSGMSYSLSIAWKIPKTWIVNGTGTVENLVPQKGNGYRYRGYKDETWNTPTGGISHSDSGGTNTVVTDEYSGNIHTVYRPNWTTVSAGNVRILTHNGPDNPAITIGSAVPANVYAAIGMGIPDGSPYAKGFSVSSFLLINDKLYVHGLTRAGAVPILVKVPNNRFQSVANTNDTLYFDPTSIVRNPFANAVGGAINSLGNRLNTYVRGSVARYILSSPGVKIREATDNGETIVWNQLDVVFPTIPSKIEDLTVNASGGYVWNLDVVNPVFHAIVKTPTYFAFVKHEAGTWRVLIRDIAKAQIDSSNSARGDLNYIGHINGENTLWTSSNVFLLNLSSQNPGGNPQWLLRIDTNTNSVVVTTPNHFATYDAGTETGYSYTGIDTAFGTCYGFSRDYGYMAIRIARDYSSMRIISSTKPGAHEALTEKEWLDVTKGVRQRYQTFASASSSTGLIAYVSEYPIFLGGYYSSIPQSEVVLQPNADNYIYAQWDAGTRSVVVTTNTTRLNNTFSRVCLAKVTTNADKVIGSVVYSVDGTALPNQEGKAGSYLSTDGKRMYWKNHKELQQAMSMLKPEHLVIVNEILQRIETAVLALPAAKREKYYALQAARSQNS